MASLRAARHYRWPGVIFCMSLATQASHRLRGVCACVLVWVGGGVDRLQAPCLLGRIVFLQCLMRYWDPRCSRRSIPCATRALATWGIVTGQWSGEAPCRALRWLFSCYDILAVRSASLYNFWDLGIAPMDHLFCVSILYLTMSLASRSCKIVAQAAIS